MTRRSPCIVVAMLRCLLTVAMAVCLALSVEGCSLAIADKERFGPNPEVDLKEGSTRANVERMLGEPVIVETLPDGNVRAVYEYTTREGKSVREWTRRPYPESIWLDVDMFTFGVAEFVFMPWAYFAKDKHTYQMEIVYSPAGIIVDRFPARDKDRAQGWWEECASEADRVLPGKHATQEWRTLVHRCVKGKTTEIRTDAGSMGEAPPLNPGVIGPP